jgi:alginate O-acetyltransferase complex protein AlgI
VIADLSFWGIVAVTVVVFWLLPARLRVGFLALVSIGYLLTLEPAGVAALLAFALGCYFFAPYAATGRLPHMIVPILVLALLGYLAYFKYVPRLVATLAAGSLGASIAIPLGISYFTFKLIHYVIEVGRGNIVDRSLSQFFCYVFLFPIFSAGPIERFDHFLANQDRQWQLPSTVEGVTRIFHGLIKKFVFASLLLLPLDGGLDALPGLVDRLGTVPTYKIWAFLVIAYLYAYLDFSAYSDVAIGCSRLFGFRIAENFNFPVLAADIGTFWKRWHMTLANWCQAYVYMPTLGLTRNPYAALYATMLAMGLWHAGSLNWVAWGLYHATGLAIFLTWSRIKRQRRWFFLDRGLWRFAGVPVTFAFVTASFAFTASYGLGVYTGVRLLAKLFFINLPA